MSSRLELLVGSRHYADLLRQLSGEEMLRLARLNGQSLSEADASVCLYDLEFHRKLESLGLLREDRSRSGRHKKSRNNPITPETKIPPRFIPQPELLEVAAAAKRVMRCLAPTGPAEPPAAIIEAFVALADTSS